jgi:hypothetical protein
MLAKKPMAYQPYLPQETVSKLYTTSQALSGIAPIAESAYLSYVPASTRSWETPTHITAVEVPAANIEEDKRQPVDPVIFSILVTNETNMRLKKNFGIAFIIITCLFTLISYGIIVAASIWDWKMPPAALTALIVQAPLQMVGILFVMARNLFPTVPVLTKEKK